MSIRTQNVHFLRDVTKDAIVTNDEGAPIIYLDPESALIGAVEKFGEKAVQKGKVKVEKTQARGYTNEEAAETKEVSFRSSRRDRSSEEEATPPSRQLGSGKKKSKR